MTNKSGQTFFYVTNYRGDILQILDQQGNEAGSYSYDPWGNVITSQETTAVSGQPLGYASYVYDRNTKLYYLQARYYDAETARFISRDPNPGDSDDSSTQNGYSYASNNPVMLIDPDGNIPWLAVNATIAAYNGYKTYKAGGSWKQVAWAAGQEFVRPIKIIKYGYRFAKVSKGTVKATGQVHHVLSNKIMRSLNNHPTLKGKFNREDLMFKYRPKDLESHKGYQKWHREYDAKVVNWLENNPRSTEQQFRKYLNDLHQQTWLKDRIPNVNIK